MRECLYEPFEISGWVATETGGGAGWLRFYPFSISSSEDSLAFIFDLWVLDFGFWDIDIGINIERMSDMSCDMIEQFTHPPSATTCGWKWNKQGGLRLLMGRALRGFIRGFGVADGTAPLTASSPTMVMLVQQWSCFSSSHKSVRVSWDWDCSSNTGGHESGPKGTPGCRMHIKSLRVMIRNHRFREHASGYVAAQEQQEAYRSGPALPI